MGRSTLGVLFRTLRLAGGCPLHLLRLHLGRFAEPLLRWLFFLSGIAGCLMVASGLVLWAVKQRQKVAKAKAKGERAGAGLRLVESLNIVRSTAVASTS